MERSTVFELHGATHLDVLTYTYSVNTSKIVVLLTSILDGQSVGQVSSSCTQPCFSLLECNFRERRLLCNQVALITLHQYRLSIHQTETSHRIQTRSSAHVNKRGTLSSTGHCLGSVSRMRTRSSWKSTLGCFRTKRTVKNVNLSIAKFVLTILYYCNIRECFY